MKFTPKSEKEIKELNLLPEGEYPFQISGAEDTISKSGNDMIKLTVRVFKPDGNFNLITDYLLEAIAYKLRHICDATGLTSKYESGALSADDFIGKEGMLKLSIKKDSNGQYADQNQVKDYIVDADKKPLPKKDVSGTVAEDLSDDIPFN